MPIADIAGLTALNGLAAQLTALSVIVLAFVLLGRVTPLGGVVWVWAGAWVAALVAIAAMFTRYLLLPGYDHLALESATVLSNGLDFVYQSGKLLYGGLLLLGALLLRRLRPRRGVLALGVAVLLGWAGLSAATTNDPTGLVQWQIPLMVPLLAATAVALMPGVGPGRDRLAGTGPAAWIAAGLAVLWLSYSFAFNGGLPAGPFATRLNTLVRLNSYLDLFGHMALAFALAHVASRGMQDRLVTLHRELAETHDQLRHAVRFDELTGVYNRRAFEELALDRGWLEDSALCVAMLDMDNLKEINDQRGHAAGDAALAHLAARLSTSLADSVVFRWGGDEFLCISRRCPADALGERIGEALDELGPVPGLGGMRIEASVGSVQRAPDESLPVVIGRADRAMYEEKFRRRHSAMEQRSLWEDGPDPA